MQENTLTENTGWDDYWAGSSSGVAYGAEGVRHPVLDEFWTSMLTSVKQADRVLDVACGRGAVLEHLGDSDAQVLETIAVDYSEPALRSLREHYPDVMTVAADVVGLPFADSRFDLVLSQFGVEYGGVAAVKDLARLCAPSGQLAMVIHAEGSLVYRECETNLRVLEELRELRFISCAIEMFQAGYAVMRGQIGRKEAGAAARRVLEPFHGLRSIMDRYGEDVAGGTIQTLYRETARIQERFQYHDETEVLQWLRTMEVESDRYGNRMRSMLQSAFTVSDVSTLLSEWQERGLKVERSEALSDLEGQVLGWSVCARNE